MKNLLFLFLLSPIWAVSTTWFVLHVFNCCIGLVFFLIGLARGIVRRKNLLWGLVVTLIQIGVFSGLAWFSTWFFHSLLSVGNTKSQKIMFWFVAIVLGLSYVPELIQKTRRNWDFAHVPGAIEGYAMKRKLGLVK